MANLNALCTFHKFSSIFSHLETKNYFKDCIIICLNLQKSVENSYKRLVRSLLRRGNNSGVNGDAVAAVKTTAAHESGYS